MHDAVCFLMFSVTWRCPAQGLDLRTPTRSWGPTPPHRASDANWHAGHRRAGALGDSSSGTGTAQDTMGCPTGTAQRPQRLLLYPWLGSDTRAHGPPCVPLADVPPGNSDHRFPESSRSREADGAPLRPCRPRDRPQLLSTPRTPLRPGLRLLHQHEVPLVCPSSPRSSHALRFPAAASSPEVRDSHGWACSGPRVPLAPTAPALLDEQHRSSRSTSPAPRPPLPQPRPPAAAHTGLAL